jgi:hypothetical protein
MGASFPPRFVLRKNMAHWNEIRDAWCVEQFRVLSDIPTNLIDRFEETGDIADLAKLMAFLRSCDSQKKNKDTSTASPTS